MTHSPENQGHRIRKTSGELSRRVRVWVRVWVWGGGKVGARGMRQEVQISGLASFVMTTPQLSSQVQTPSTHGGAGPGFYVKI